MTASATTPAMDMMRWRMSDPIVMISSPKRRFDSCRAGLLGEIMHEIKRRRKVWDSTLRLKPARQIPEGKFVGLSGPSNSRNDPRKPAGLHGPGRQSRRHYADKLHRDTATHSARTL